MIALASAGSSIVSCRFVDVVDEQAAAGELAHGRDRRRRPASTTRRGR